MSIMQLDAKKRPPMITAKQIAVLRALIKRNPDGSYLDVKELIQECAPGQARGSMVCTIRHLNAHGLIREDELVTRRGRRVRTYAATQKGIDLMRPVGKTPGVLSNLVTP